MQINNTDKFLQSSLWGWCLFDFANSIAAVIGGIYFSKWFIEDLGASPILFNTLLFLSALIILLTGKWVGKKIDTNGYVFWIKFSSLITFSAIVIIFVGSRLLPHSILIPFSFISFLIFLFGYQISRICHNVYLSSVIPKEIQSKMSGYGAASNWAGSIIGIILTIPIVTFYPNIFGRELTFLLAAICYGFLTLISLILMFASKIKTVENSAIGTKKYSWNYFLITLGSSFIIYFLLFDVMVTVQKNLPPFLTKVFSMNDETQAFGFLLVLISAMVGGLFAAKKINYSNSKLWLKISSFLLTLAILLITIKNPYSLWIAFALAGITYGILESVIRLNFMATFSSENAGENFGVLAAVERSSGVFGPLLWIIPFSLIQNEEQSYIASMLLMSCMTFVAFCLLIWNKKVKTE